jgi:glycosyltransferase involved in cell wall biosynthesis
MRVAVNGRYLVQRITGQQRYAREIVARLAERMDVVAPPGKSQGVRGHLWEQLALPRRVNGDLLWSPSTTGPLAVRRQVLTIHDCAFFDQARCFSRAFAAWYQFLVPRLARKAQQIITVSEFSKQRIVELCGVVPDKVTVVYSGVSPQFRPHSAGEIAAARQRHNLPPQYVLCVGSLEPRKNLSRLLEAWQLIQPRLAGLSLVIVGARSHVFRDAGLAVPRPSVHLAGYLSDDELAAVYAGAEMFVYPSLYEGFGLPVLEAMASGVPVITSNATALAEVAGDAAVTVDPLSIESIAAGLERLASNAALRSGLREKGVARVRSFTWEQAATETWQVLEAAA